MRLCNTYANAPSDEEEGNSPTQSPEYGDFGGRGRGISPQGRLSPRGSSRSHLWEMDQEKDAAELPIELASQSTWRTWAASSFTRHFLSCGLIIGAFVGYNFPWLGSILYRTPVSVVCLSVVFFFLGMELRMEDCWDSIAARRATTIGIINILIITPILSAVVRMVPYQPAMLWTGLAIFCCMPTTMGTAVVLTRKADGSVPMACLLTVVTNIVGMVTVPFIVSGLAVNASPLGLVLKLFLSLLLPLLLGQAVRNAPGVVEWGMENREKLNITRDSFLVALPWMMISAASVRSRFVGEAGIGGLVALVGACAGVHAVFVALGAGVGAYMGMRPALFKAFVVCTSHKSMPTALAVALFLPRQRFDNKELTAVPIVLAHLAQTVIGSSLVHKWASYDDEDMEGDRYRLVHRNGSDMMLNDASGLHPDFDLNDPPPSTLNPAQAVWTPPANGREDEEKRGPKSDLGRAKGDSASNEKGTDVGGGPVGERPMLTTSHFGQRGWSNQVLGALQVARNRVLPTVLDAKVPWALSTDKSIEREERTARDDSTLELLAERNRPDANDKQGLREDSGLGQ